MTERTVHPATVAVAELTRELACEEPDFATRDAIEQAVRELLGVGLLHLHGQFLSPTRAAIRHRELLAG